jgi:archaellum biogenesis ATPase FlaH
MRIPIDIPGLNEYINEIPIGNLVVIEGTIDPVLPIFVQKIVCHASDNRSLVTYITSKTKEEVCESIENSQKKKEPFNIIEERSYRYWKNYINENTIVVIDSFSFLILDKDLDETVQILEEFLKLCKKHHAIVILTMERGMLDERIEITVAHLADGIIRFLSRDTSKGIARYIRIPKWMNGKSFDENIYYSFNGEQINVDLRSRVR